MEPWPSLKTYDETHLPKIAMPVGGIGTGCIAFGGRGDLRNWEIVNRPALGFRPARSFLAVSVGRQDGRRVTRLLEGPLDASAYEGPDGSPAANHGLPRFRHARFSAAYPLGQVDLCDDAVPIDARIEAFNPLIPGDVDASSIPMAVVRARLTNRMSEPLSVGVCMTMTNFIGTDGTDGAPSKNMNLFRSDSNVAGIMMTAPVLEPTSPYWGTMAMTTIGTTATSGHDVTHRACWPAVGWNGDVLEVWEDFAADGRLDSTEPDSQPDAPIASLAESFTLSPGASDCVTFLLTWHFPNRLTWSPNGHGNWLSSGRCGSGLPVIGNYYTQKYRDAWHVAAHVAEHLPQLETETIAFVRAICDSDVPAVAKEAALFNLSTLKTQTCFRTPDGHFFGWEGVFENTGSCLGSCTHVWNYEWATPLVFGELAKSMREIEFQHMTGDDGLMRFRVHLPLQYARMRGIGAADGQMGCIIKAYREWQLGTVDDAWLLQNWPRVKAALAFCWLPGGWDGDRDGVMEGCQHNTMDVEYFGPNPQMTGWYLAALRAGEAMARQVGEPAFADDCKCLFESGSRWVDRNLFNGEYYEHEIRPPGENVGRIASGLKGDGAIPGGPANPEFQLGAGCLVDQLAGQYAAHLCGLGYVLDAAHVKTTLESIERYNRRNDFHDHFNPMRSFVLGDDSALLMASYPRGRRPAKPFPYFGEVMTGFEYTAAIGMIQEGLTEAGINAVTAIRNRYDGQHRNPFDESECGRHYARAMASWALIPATTGFQFSAPDESIEFAWRPTAATFFWSNGSAWGTFRQTPSPPGTRCEVTVGYGELLLRRLSLAGMGTIESPATVKVTTSQSWAILVPHRVYMP